MKAVVFTLGCKVNECESWSLLAGLQERGFEVSDRLEPADLYILNTCAVTAEAEKKSRQAVARIRAVSKDAPIAAFLQKSGVFLVTGARQKGELFRLLDEKQRGAHIAAGGGFDELPPPLQMRARAFIKVQDGCNNFCSYCIIPYLRGRTCSRSLESAAAEILSQKAAETVITGIDLSSYNDRGRGLSELLLAVKDAPCRIRLGSLEAGVITEHLLEAAKQVRRFAPHFHLSLQSGSDAVLKKMNRHYTREQFLEKVRLIRSFFPDAAVTTDVIVGFPTETEEDFAATLDLCEQAGFSQVHCFPYSRRAGTAAARLPDLSAAVKKSRLHRLQALAGRLRAAYEGGYIGKPLAFVPEEEEDGYTVGYSQNYIRLYAEGRIEGPCTLIPVRPFQGGLLAERTQ